MAYPIAPVGEITRQPASALGIVREFAWARDFRPDAENWFLAGVEYDDETKCFAPIAWPEPKDAYFTTDGGEWEITKGAYWSYCSPYGYPRRQFLLAGDSAAHPMEETPAWSQVVKHVGTVPTRWMLHLLRYAPPVDLSATPRELIWPQVVVGMPARWYHSVTVDQPDGTKVAVWGWWPAVVSLYLPLRPYGDSTPLPSPALHAISKMDRDYPGDGLYYTINEVGKILAVFSGAGADSQNEIQDRGVAASCVKFETFEYVSDGVHKQVWRIGLTGSKDYWYYQNDNLVVEPSLNMERWFGIAVRGHAAAFNLSRLVYNAGSAAYRHEVEPPADANVGAVAVGGTSDTEAHGWAVTCTNPAREGRVAPQIDWDPGTTGDRSERVCVYNAWAECAPTWGTPAAGLPETTETTQNLVYLSVTKNRNNRGMTGEARFACENAETLPNWKLNDLVTIKAGWDAASSLPASTQMQAFIMSPVRRRSGEEWMGAAVYSFQFGDFVAARMRDHKRCIDMRDASGQLLGTWYRAIWERMGIPSSMVDVAASAELVLIPSNALPGEDGFAPGDNDSMERHIDEVTWACGYRWGLASSGRPFLVADAPYVHGTSAIGFTLDENTATDEDVVFAVEHSLDGSQTTNRWKIVIGSGKDAKVFYRGDPYATRLAGIGDHFENVVSYPTYRDFALGHNKLLDETSRRANTLRWETIARPDLDCGEYVEVNTADYVDVAAGTVFELETHTMTIEDATGTSSFEGGVVYEP